MKEQKQPWEIEPDNWAEMTEEERIEWMFAHTPPRPVKRKPALTLEVSQKVAEAIQENPESVRVAVSGNPGVVERVRPTEIVQVISVDSQGRPHQIRRIDLVTKDEAMIEMDQGYRPQSTVVHSYNPIDALRSGDDR
jgi:hypothetical protein